MTKVYGTSDDLIEFEGEFTGEIGCYGTDEKEQGVLIFFNDNTILEIKYGKSGSGIWGITVVRKGSCFDRIEICCDEDVKPYSDIVYLKEGIKWAYAATEWERVK